MAKKKGKKNGSAGTDSEAVDLPEPLDEPMEALEPMEGGELEGNEVDPEELPAAATEDMSVSQLQSQLAEAREEIKQLREELARKDLELQQAGKRGPDASVKVDNLKLNDVQKLQERLLQLRKEQAEADAARDAAWKQLKSVVNDISKLASPDYLASINIPTS